VFGSDENGARWRRVVRLLALVFALGAVAAGCGGDDDDGGDTAATEAEGDEEAAGEGSIWVLLPDSATSPRWESDDRRFFEQFFSEAGVDYTIVNAEGDANTQLQQAEQAVNAGAKVILLVNLSSESGATIIETAREADVQVIDYDRLTAAGVPVGGPPEDRPWGERSFALYDPDGNELRLYAPPNLVAGRD